MSEERLKEIKDILVYQDEVALYEDDYDMLVDLYNEVIRLREELSKCTRKYWQSKCAEHCVNEKLLQIKIDKAIEYIEKHRKVYKLGVNQETDEFDYISTSPQVLLNILRGGNNV